MAIKRRVSDQAVKALKAEAKFGRLLPAVERWHAARNPDWRDQRVLHPSDMCKADWCPRGAAYDLLRPPERKQPALRTQNIFDAGHDIHHRWQRRLADMGVLYGSWTCENCGYRISNVQPESKYCSSCNTFGIRYDEVSIVDVRRLIHGHADGWVKGVGYDLILEIKSIGSGTVRMEAPGYFEQFGGDPDLMWRHLKKPFSSHIRQAQIYLRVLNENRTDAPKEALFLYEYKWNQDYKEFVVEYAPHMVQDIFDRALAVADYVKHDGPAPYCPWGGCSKCKGKKL